MRTARRYHPRMKSLLHLTLNTGDCFEQVRGDVNDDALAALTPLISRRGGLLPAPFGAFRVEINEQIDSAGLLFSVIRGADSIVTCGLCWDIRGAGLIWGVVNGLYLHLVAAIEAAPAHAAMIPGRVPWLAVVLLPGVAAQRNEDISWLGDFERCMAFAILNQIERKP